MKEVCDTKDCKKLATIDYMIMGLDLKPVRVKSCNICMKAIVKGHINGGGVVVDGTDDKNIKVKKNLI